MYVDVLKRQFEIAARYAIQGNFKRAYGMVEGRDLFFNMFFRHFDKDRRDINSYQKVTDSFLKKIIKTNAELNKALKFRVNHSLVKDFLALKFFKGGKLRKEGILPEVKILSDSIFIELYDPETEHIFTYGLLITRLSCDKAEIKILSYSPERNAWCLVQTSMQIVISFTQLDCERGGSFFVGAITNTAGMDSMLNCFLTYGQDDSIDVNEGAKDFIKSLNDLIKHFTGVAVEVLLAISSREVTIRSITEKKTVPRVGKAKKGKRKVASITYNVIDFPLEEEVHLLTNTGGGTKHVTHASPRQHTRVGHWRKCRTKSVWIEPTVVGKAENGTVDKEYRVVRKAVTIKRVNNETNNPELPGS